MGRRKPIVTALRVDQRERRMIDQAAADAGIPVATLLRRIVLPEIATRVSQAAQEMAAAERQETVPA